MRTCTYLDPRHMERCTECGITIDLCTCDGVDWTAHDRVSSPDGLMFRAVRAEIASARLAFPETRHMLCALMEEVGELAQAIMEHDRGEGKTTQEVFREAVQVACMAIRIGTEGDDNFEYEPATLLRE